MFTQLSQVSWSRRKADSPVNRLRRRLPVEVMTLESRALLSTMSPTTTVSRSLFILATFRRKNTVPMITSTATPIRIQKSGGISFSFSSVVSGLAGAATAARNSMVVMK